MGKRPTQVEGFRTGTVEKNRQRLILLPLGLDYSTSCTQCGVSNSVLVMVFSISFFLERASLLCHPS